MMSSETPQLPLAFELPDGATFGNYVPGPNAAAHRSVELAACGKGEQTVYLWGLGGTGKTHLLEAACRVRRLHGAGVAYVPMRARDTLQPSVLDGLENLALVCVDDLERIAGHCVWEEALFHLFNRAQATGTRLLLTAAARPVAQGLQIADLVSRLSASLVYQLRQLNDAQRVVAMQRRAQDRGFMLSEEVAAYLIRRQRRDMGSLLRLVDRLDRASLAAQRRITIPFIRGMLAAEEL